MLSTSGQHLTHWMHCMQLKYYFRQILWSSVSSIVYMLCPASFCITQPLWCFPSTLNFLGLLSLPYCLRIFQNLPYLCNIIPFDRPKRQFRIHLLYVCRFSMRKDFCNLIPVDHTWTNTSTTKSFLYLEQFKYVFNSNCLSWDLGRVEHLFLSSVGTFTTYLILHDIFQCLVPYNLKWIILFLKMLNEYSHIKSNLTKMNLKFTTIHFNIPWKVIWNIILMAVSDCG